MMDNKRFFLERYEKMGQKIDPASITMRKALRINTLKISKEELVRRLSLKKVKLQRIPFLQNGYWYDAGFSLGSTPEYLQGYYYLQEPASQLPPEVLSPDENDVVLDCCAAPGSKTTQLAQLMDNKGTIIALEPNRKRMESLKNNLERIGARNTITYQMDAKDAASLGIKFDKILLDAPCSGNFALNTDWFARRDMPGIKNNSQRQKNILETCLGILKPKGLLG